MLVRLSLASASISSKLKIINSGRERGNPYRVSTVTSYVGVM